MAADSGVFTDQETGRSLYREKRTGRIYLLEPELPKENPFFKWKAVLLHEIAMGGDQAPCPFCGVPRVERSDYIRCCRCGVNWRAGEDRNHDPNLERHAGLMRSAVIATMPQMKK